MVSYVDGNSPANAPKSWGPQSIPALVALLREARQMILVHGHCQEADGRAVCWECSKNFDQGHSESCALDDLVKHIDAIV